VDERRAKQILDRIRAVRVAVCGDFCLDAYWDVDPRGSEISAETGLKAEAVSSQRYALGGAGNVVANIAALRPASVAAIGVAGDDPFGREMLRLLAAAGADVSGLVVQEDGFETMVYAKRMADGVEQARVDFGTPARRSRGTEAALLHALRAAAESADVLVLNQQVPGSIPDPAFIEAVNTLAAEFPDRTILLDSRHYGAKFRGVARKMNAAETARLAGVEPDHGGRPALDDLRRFALAAYRADGKPVFVTRGDRGMLAADRDGVHEIPGIHVVGETDPVGAGDTALSALACGLAAGATAAEAAELANFAASITVRQLRRTGTASPEEIQRLAADCDYVHRPELADDPRCAVFAPGSQIELCAGPAADFPDGISHAVVDHDGTVSTLREGWETVMEPMMVRAILGDRHASAAEVLRRKVRDRVRRYIDQSTGTQTVFQMETLAAMVREFGLVPPERIQDKFGYKKIYNDALMDTVRKRIEKVRRGEAGAEEWTIRGAVAFFRALRERGVTLYLASGTDAEDVRAEAAVLGYADLFNGGIFGAVADRRDCSKQAVIEDILRRHRLRGAQLAAFGDGPVEIRECVKRGGFGVGIASDEVRRHGLNLEKRARLIRAGAHVVVPDFSQGDRLVALLFRGA
jgi:rfaE bifunctional protein kinase chain/domain